MDSYLKAWQLPNMTLRKLNYRDMVGLTDEQKSKMDRIVKAAKESHQFYQTFTRYRDKGTEGESEAMMVFNKRHFTSHSSVVITNDARKIMARNADVTSNDHSSVSLTKMELRLMKSVVDGLKLIHKGQDNVKDVLSSAITYETFNAYEYVTHSCDEKDSSCYYVVNGSVEVTYDMNADKSRSVYQPNILYSHGAGEYIGLVSPEGREDDLSPPATIYTREYSEFIKINRNLFHQLVEQSVEILSQEKRRFLCSSECELPISPEIIEKILDKLTKQELPSNKMIIHQGELSDEMFLIVSGRCRLSREVILPDSQKKVRFAVGIKSRGGFLGEECILDRCGSYSQAVTTSPTVCYKLHRSALEIVQKELLYNLIQQFRHDYPNDVDLFERGHRSCVWNFYKHREIKTSLEEQGKLQYLYVPNSKRGRSRPQSTEDIYRENMFRFIEKGGKYEPISNRVQSAVNVKSDHHHHLPPRATTVLGTVTSGQDEDAVEENGSESTEDKRDEPSVKFPSPVSSVLDKQVPRERMNKNVEPDGKELVRLLTENADLSRQFKMAWEEHEKENTGFTKTGVLASMSTEDIVRKAKALAEKQSTNTTGGGASDDDEEWSTILHEENRNAKMHIAADKYRVAMLKRKLKVLAKRHDKGITAKIETPNFKRTDENTSRVSVTDRLVLSNGDNPSDAVEGTTTSNGDLQRPKTVTFQQIQQPSYCDNDINGNNSVQLPKTNGQNHLNLSLSTSPDVISLETDRLSPKYVQGRNGIDTENTFIETEEKVIISPRENTCSPKYNRNLVLPKSVFPNNIHVPSPKCVLRNGFVGSTKMNKNHNVMNSRSKIDCKTIAEKDNLLMYREGLKKLKQQHQPKEFHAHISVDRRVPIRDNLTNGDAASRKHEDAPTNTLIRNNGHIKVRPSTSCLRRHHSVSDVPNKPVRPQTTSGIRHRSIGSLMSRYSLRLTTNKTT